MQKITELIKKASKLMDTIAGWGIVAIMALVVINVLLRVIFNSPILGVYEYVGYTTAGVIAFSIAYCALQNAHIAIEFIFEKMPLKSRKIINIISAIVIVLFLLFLCVQVVVYAVKVMSTGEVSPTAKMPFYPFIFMAALGIFVLSLIEFIKIVKGVGQECQQK
ncbi:MAG: TRAP transporter small permease [Clostridiaceae bacterium]|jgi:TRAP-type C4-dicarboxylate transport system permease small subunit|nr:TRAP transporter small permease [Clostridiaceae bacterium]